MSYRVVQWSTGNVGRHALAGIDAHPELDLVGVFVSNPAKIGRDAGELAGLGRSLGVSGSNDFDALLALKPDCIVHTGMADDRMMEALADLQRFLEAGCNVVSSSPVFLQYPADDDDMARSLHAAGVAHGVSLFVNGVDPGFANDALPLVLTGISERIEEVRCSEVLNYNTYNQPMVLFDIMGFGRPMDEVPFLLQPGVLTLAWGSVVRQIAAGLGVALSGVEEWYEREAAPGDFDVDAGPIAKGTAAALHFEIRGMVGDKAVVVVEHVTRLSDDLGAELAPTGRAWRLPGPDHGRAQLHPRPPTDGHRRRPQYGRPQGHGHAPGQRHPCRHRSRTRHRDGARPPADHRPGSRGHLIVPLARSRQGDA